MLLKDLINGLSSLIFPPVCKSCNKRIDSNMNIICNECWNGLVRVDKEIFLQKEIPENINKVYAIFQFDDLFQKIIHALKYQGNNSIGVELGKRMSKYVEPEMVNKERGMFVPVPLHPIKYRERGYNQAEAIARGLSIGLDIPLNTRLIKRVKNTSTQTKLNAEERRKNMESAFVIDSNSDIEKIRQIVLVDDVFTTGSTMNSAAKVLKESGINKVVGLAAATPAQENHKTP